MKTGLLIYTLISIHHKKYFTSNQ